ncbi:MAG: diguanylate cyclase [Hyphomicrobiales bacterium]|nr:diguanylate cyclase [Hyphomicrobiales bacterium]
MRLVSTASPDHGRLRRLKIFLVASMVLIAISMLGIFGQLALDSQRDAIDNAMLKNENLRRIATRSISQVMESMDLSIKAAISGLQIVEKNNFPTEISRSIIFDNSARNSIYGTVLLLDESGRVAWDMRDPAPPNFSRAGRDYFDHHIAADTGLYVSTPFKAINRAEYSIALSRRINGPNGEFRGVAVGTINLKYFANLFEGLQLGGGSAVLFRNDGTLLMRQPYQEKDLGIRLSSSEFVKRLAVAPQGNFEAVAALDGVVKLVSYARVEPYPVIVSFSTPKAYVISAWLSKTIKLLAVVATLLVVAAGVGLMLWRELKLRFQAETELKRVAAELEVMASMDKLTGLANRRSFDRSLREEMLRARRSNSQVALIMIDVDRFKQFNDTHGHVRGDLALQVTASCIGMSIRRPGDVAARYGGEEFAVILPNTDERGAVRVAESIRAELLARKIPHLASASGLLTVSIGICTARPGQVAITERQLVEQADAALYRAKMSGRDTTVVGDSNLEHADFGKSDAA